MTTDTAVRVTRIVIQDQKALGDITYVDYPEIKINKHESTEMPFRYVAKTEGAPYMPAGMMELIAKDTEKGIDDLF
jgi:ribosome biogenesis SPOUT family RNA methylase Rps3